MLHFDFSEEPVWLDCKCGAKTNQVPCWDCKSTVEAATEKRYQDAIRDRSIPPRYAGASLANVAMRVRGWRAQYAGKENELELTVARVERFTAFVKANPRQSITFVGESGAGKTTLATWALVNNPLYGVFVRASDLERARKEQALGKAAGLIETAERAGVLLLDEVRTEGVAFGGTFDVLDYRHGRNLPTYSTTGLSDMKIGAALGDGAVRRLFEEPGVKVVRL